MNESDIVTDIDITKIDDLGNQIIHIREYMIEMRERLMEICKSLETENYIAPELLTSSAEYLTNYLRTQEDFFEQILMVFPQFIKKDYTLATEILEDAKAKAEAQDLLTILLRFQQVNIDNPDIKPLLAERKNRALEIAQATEGEALESRGRAYLIFMNVMDHQDIELTQPEEEALETEFPRPMPRLLYQGKFYMEPCDNKKDASKIEATPIIEAEAYEDETPNEFVSSQYTFSTTKKGSDFHVKDILAYLRQSDINDRIQLLAMLKNCQVLSAEQLVRWVFYDEKLLEFYLTPLLKKGYLTEIIEKGSQEQYFSFSEKGMAIFTKKSVIEEFHKHKWLVCEQTFIRPFEERQDLIKKTFLLNEAALQIINDREITNYVHSETSICQLPYLSFAAQERYYLLITEGSQKQGVLEEINGILDNVRFDRLVYVPIDGTDEDAWQILSSLSLDADCCYVARFSDMQITYTDAEGNLHNSIIRTEEFDQQEMPGDVPDVASTDFMGKDDSPKSSLVDSQEISDAPPFDCQYNAPVEAPQSSITSPGTQREAGKQEQIEFLVVDTSSSTQIATVLLSNYNKPDFNYRDFKEVDFSTLLTHLLSENKIMEAVVLAKALTFIKDKSEFGKFYNRLLAAVNYSLDPHIYTGLSLSKLDADEASADIFDGTLIKLLRLSCFAWALCIPDEQHDFHLYNHRFALLEQLDDLGKISVQLDNVSVELKQIFVALFDLKDISPSGFSPKVLANFISEENRKNHQSDLVKKAEELLIEPQVRQRINGAPELLSTCFGKNSNLYRCMQIICKSDFEQKPFVTQTLALFGEHYNAGACLENPDSLSYSEQKIQDYIDKTWKTINAKIPVLRYSPRNTILFGIKKRLEVMCEWLEINDDNSQKLPESLFAKLNKTRNQLLNRMDSVGSQLDELCSCLELAVQAGARVLRHTLNSLYQYLEIGVPPHDRWEYISLLSSYQINLDKEHKPNIIAKMQEIAGFEPWRRMLEHIVSPKIDPLQAILLIDNPKEQNWYNNYGTAEHLNLYLHELTGHPMRDLSQTHIAVQQLADKYEEEFKSEFELKYAYGCIEESTKESIFHIAAVLSGYFKEAGDIAHYRSFLTILQENSEKETKELENILASRMREIIDNDGLTNESAPILKNIERHLHNQNLAVAEEYLNRLDRGELSIPDEELEVDKETDYHGAFLEKYDRLYRICQKNKGDVMRNWGFKSIESELNRDWTSRYIQNSERFIGSWPKRKDDPGNANAVVNVLRYIGFDTEKVERHPSDRTGDKYNYYKIYAISPEKHLRDYPHPIASFGTLMNSYIHVVCLFGSNSANELINIMANKLQLGGNTVVLMDGALSLIDRRKVAEQFKSQTSGQNSFLLIDRVLMLYLATLDAGERLLAMFKCTLPYTFYQPFSKDGGSIADEMFYGRKAELNDILLPTGSCLVYGGRQLGKTALLERARSIAHQPAEKKFALYIDIYREGQSGLVKRLNYELREIGLINKVCESLEEICRELENGFNTGEIIQLHLFIDETDEFLSEASTENYSVLRPLLNIKRRTKNQFKFVLAGLHNVARSRHALDNNGILPQLGAPLCIKPLSPADAKKLVERPLSYLGFKMGEQQLALILANTNYYPGILHFFCYTLVQSVSDKYTLHYRSYDNPPYPLKDSQMKTIFASEDLNKSIKDKLHMTLDLDIRYKMIANVLAFMNYEDEQNETTRLQGYYDTKTIQENIEETCDSPCFRDLAEPTLEALLHEMVDMGILSSKPNSNLFRFRKNSFLGTIGSEDQVLEALLEGSEVASL